MISKWTEKRWALNFIIAATVNSCLYSPKVKSNGVAFFFKLSFSPWLISPSLKWFEYINLSDIWWSLPTLKGLAMHNFLVFWKNSLVLIKRIICALFHDAKFGHTFINISKQLNWNVLQYTILCLQSILSVCLIINTNFQLSTFYHPKEIRSHSGAYTGF